MLTLRAQGKSRKQVAHLMGITENTVRAHVAHAYAKLEVGSILDALRAVGLVH